MAYLGTKLYNLYVYTRFKVWFICKRCGIKFKRKYRNQWYCKICNTPNVISETEKEISKLKLTIVKLKKKLENRKTIYRDRQRLINKLGGMCIYCGFGDWRALQIDHTYGGGTKELKKTGGNKRTYYAKVIKDHTGKYQLLCANCSWIKRWENNELGGNT